MRSSNARAVLVLGACLSLSACGGGDAGGPIDFLPASEGIYLNAMPPGANGNSAGGIGSPVPGAPIIEYPPHFTDALALYGDLAYAQPGLKATPCDPPKDATAHVASSDLACNYYKHEGLEPDVVESTQTLQAPNGKVVTLRRDGWGVPFVEGQDRLSAMYGVGWASAEDRLWLHDVLRTIGRGRFSEYLGPAPDTYGFDSDLAAVAGYSEEEITAMVDSARAKFGPLGDLLVADVDAMVAGINGYVATLSGANADKIPPEYDTLVAQVGGVRQAFPPRPWTRNDIVASAILIQSIFANGGGGEHINNLLLQRLDPSFGPASGTIPAAACNYWRDVRHANDPDTPRTVDTPWPTQSPGVLSEACPQAVPAGAAILDPGSYQARLMLDVPEGGLGKSAAPRRQGGKAPRFIPDLLRAAPSPVAFVRAPLRPEAMPAQRFYASLDPVAGAREALARAGFPMPATLSNFIGVTADQTANGHPIAVMGPQAAYFLPQLLWEVAVKSNGGTDLDFAGRGIVFGDLPYINIGRGIDYAFSATSGGSDIVDIRVVELCNTDGSPATRDGADTTGFPNADGYLYFDAGAATPTCREFYRRTDTWTATPTAASLALGCADGPQEPTCHATSETVRRHILRTHHGPVFATATVNGRPVAIVRQRSTFFGELDTAPPFALATTRTVKSAQSFQQLFNSCTGTFNWLYTDAHDLGYIHSGLYPKRHPDVHPELPSWGNGRFEWESGRTLPAGFLANFGGDKLLVTNLSRPVVQGDPLKGYFEWEGYLPLSAHPTAINPAKGWITSWNNNPAAGWWAADANGTFGPTHRADMLGRRLAAFKATGRKHDVATMIEIAADAGFTDQRGQEVLPLLLDLMDDGALTADQQGVLSDMRAWLDESSNAWIGNAAPKLGAWRRDRDQSGTYDFRAQVVLMDAWYAQLIDEVLPQLVAHEGFIGHGRYDAPRAQGSAFQEGWYQHLKRVLQMALGQTTTPYRVLRCGDGSAADCRAKVLVALDKALVKLGGYASRASWDGSELPAHSAQTGGDAGGTTVEDYDAVQHTAISFLNVPPIHWVNRPTFQQAVQVQRQRLP